MFIGFVIWFGIVTETYVMLVGFLTLVLAVVALIRFTSEETYETQEDEV
jgi:hypothetical protein